MDMVKVCRESARGKLTDLLDVKRRLDTLNNEIEEEIKDLRKEQQLMQFSFRDADVRQYKRYLGQMRILSYRVQDLLETPDLEVEHREGKGVKKVLRSLGCLMQAPFALKNLETKIADIKQGIRDVSVAFSKYKAFVKKLPIPNNEDDHRLIQTSTDVPAEDFVGMDKDIADLVSLMISEDGNCPFISICGMFGTGKTALARKLYNHPRAQGYFQRFAWIDLGKTTDRKTVLQDILKQLLPRGLNEEIMEIEDKMFTQLCNIKEKRKCLVVLDGIESLDAWEVVQVAFTSAKTSKILLTTRMREIAETVAGNGYIHTMSCLTEEEGWELLKRKASARAALDGSEFQGMTEEVGKNIVSRCKGLPFAIEMIGCFIAERREVWEQIHNNMVLPLAIVAEDFQALASIFNDLPNHLKPCFLYLRFFPDECEIEVDKLYQFWMAEDMITSEDRDSGKEENRMEIAEEYLKKLQIGSLVDVEEEEVPTLRRFKSCRLHVLMRVFCVLKAEEEEFVKVIDYRSGNQEERDSSSFYNGGSKRRLIIYMGKNTQRFPKSFTRETAKYLRCLLIYMDKELESVFPQDLSNLSRFRVLRVLDFDGVDFCKMKLPRGISKLKRLRYLSFKGCILEALPENIGSLSYLQVLDLQVGTTMKIPDILWKLKRLRHLYFPRSFQPLSHGKLQLGSLSELETLKHFNTNSCNVEDLLKLTNLRYLASDTKGSVEDLERLVKRMSMTTDRVLCCSIHVTDFDCYTEERHSVFRQLLGSRALRTFSIEGYLGEIPSFHSISQLLAEIVFSGSELKQDAMLAFQELPNLRVLVLEKDAFIGAEMDCKAAGFWELRRFRLSDLSVLAKLTIEEDAFPKLSAFTIQNCTELTTKKMPAKLERLLGRKDGK